MLMAAAGCQEEINQPAVQQPVEEGYQTVTFSVNVPEDAQTKAISDGLSATNLQYAVYRAEEYVDPIDNSIVYPKGQYLEFLSNGEDANSPLNNATIEKKGERNWLVTLTLAKNVKYDIVFWAYADNAPYTFDEANAVITVDDDYAGAANAENRDAFYNCLKDYAVITSETKVELRRPFAQINIGADDYDPYITDLGLKMTSKIDTDAHEAEAATAWAKERPAVVATTIPTALNVLDGSVSDPVVVNFALGQIPYETGDKVLLEVGEGAEKVTYNWMSMNYILAGEEATLNNLRATFRYNEQDLTIDVPNVPYKRNYRTNILGTLFTGPAKFNVVIVPQYSGEDYIYDLNLGLVDAFNSKNGAVCNLTKDEVISEPLILDNGKTLILNLDQYSITAANDLWNTASGVWSMISVRNGSTLIINSKSGSVVARENDTYTIDVRDGSTLEINGGTYVGNISAIYVKEGKALINGGSYSIQQLSEPENGNDERFTLNCLDDSYKAGTAVIEVSGGTFRNFDPSNNKAETAQTNFLTAGHKVVAEKVDAKTTNYTVVDLNVIENAIASGAASVTLDENLVLNGTLTVPGNLTIDLGGKTLTSDASPAVLAEGNLTLKNGKVNVGGEFVRAGNGAVVAFEGVVAVSGNASESGDNCIFVPKESKDVTVTVDENSVLTTYGAAAIQTNGNTEGLTLNVNGTVVSEGDVAMYLPQVKECNIGGKAVISGTTGIEIRAGILNVEDGAKISATENTLTAKANGNGSTVTGAAIAVSPHSTNLPIAVTVNGGEFSCANSVYEAYLEPAERTAETKLEIKGGKFNAPVYSENCTGFITGGTFAEGAQPEAEYLAEGFVVGAEGEVFEFHAEASEWGVVGDLNEWGKTPDIKMYTTWQAENLFVAYNVKIASGAFKIRANNKWDDTKNYGLSQAGKISTDKYYTLINGSGSQNITPITYGTYDVYFDLKNKRIALVTPGKEYADAVAGGEPVIVVEGLKEHSWGMIGSFAASNDWKTDVKMVVEGDWAVAKNVTLAKNNEFKFRADNGWALSYGAGTSVNVGKTYTTYNNGGNMTFIGEDGSYNIYFSLLNAKFYIEKN